MRTRLLEPVLLAVVLGLVSIVPVAWTLQSAPEASVIERVDWHPLGTGQAVLLALGSVIPASVIGGLLGALAWSRRRTAAPVAAVTGAWLTGIVALPLTAAAFDIPLRAGIYCLTQCEAHLRREEPLGGLQAYAELVLTWPFFVAYLVVPGVLFVAAERFRRPALWMATWVALHAVLHVMSISRNAAPVYAALVAGVVGWTVWLWGRDTGHRALRTPVARWSVALVPATVALAIGTAGLAATWLPSVPERRDLVLVGDARLRGPNPPDSSSDPALASVRTPEGSSCLDPVIGREGRLDLCWEAYRDRREHMPGGDVYHFRLVATLHSTTPHTWAAVSIEVSGGERARVDRIWPSGVTDGPCRIVRVEGMNFLTNGSMTDDTVDDAVCGRTTAATSNRSRTHSVLWTCGGCGARDPAVREIAVREVVGIEHGAVPAWAIYAALGAGN